MLSPRRNRDHGYAASIAGELYGGSVRDDPTLARAMLRATTRMIATRGYGYQLLATVGWTSLPLLPLVRQPTLILAGDDDPIIPVINARIMHRFIPGSELTIYRGGHLDLITKAGHLAVSYLHMHRVCESDGNVSESPRIRASSQLNRA
jgi:pimeloyl-ACP methyl ester carboxylesterase